MTFYEKLELAAADARAAISISEAADKALADSTAQAIQANHKGREAIEAYKNMAFELVAPKASLDICTSCGGTPTVAFNLREIEPKGQYRQYVPEGRVCAKCRTPDLASDADSVSKTLIT
jgi:hypothetical protein